MKSKWSEIAERIKTERTIRKLKATNIAKQVGINRGYYSKIETGKAIPVADVLLNIIDALGLSYAEFFSPFGVDQQLSERDVKAEAERLFLRIAENPLVLRGVLDFLRLVAPNAKPGTTATRKK